MTEWWTYRPSDLLMFSARTHERLFESLNADWWPLHGVMLAAGFTAWGLLATRRRAASGAACIVIGCVWAWVGWAYVWRELAGVHNQGDLIAGAFVLQALLLVGGGLAQALDARRGPVASPSATPAAPFGALLMGWALLGQPLFAGLVGRPWLQAQVFGLAPDPTALFTLGLLVARPVVPRRLAWISVLPWLVPLGWCLFSAMTAWTLGAPEAWPVAVGAAWAVGVAVWSRWRARRA